jgi:hypothetical protein
MVISAMLYCFALIFFFFFFLILFTLSRVNSELAFFEAYDEGIENEKNQSESENSNFDLNKVEDLTYF